MFLSLCQECVGYPISTYLFLPGIGCADIEPPENAYAEREADKVIIGCVTSMEKVRASPFEILRGGPTGD